MSKLVGDLLGAVVVGVAAGAAKGAIKTAFDVDCDSHHHNRYRNQSRPKSKSNSKSKTPTSYDANGRPNCNGQHGLKFFNVPRTSYKCDYCGSYQQKGSEMYGCRGCNYDLCIVCYRGLTVNIARPKNMDKPPKYEQVEGKMEGTIDKLQEENEKLYQEIEQKMNDTMNFDIKKLGKKKGWMAKQGWYNTEYKKRWFVLNYEKKTLFYYYAPTSQSMQGCVNFNKTPILKIMKNDYDNSIWLYTKDRIWKFRCQNKNDHQDWYDAFQLLFEK